MVLPLLILIASCGLEFARALKLSQIATSLSRELTGVAYRECAATHGPVVTAMDDPEFCLETVVSDVKRRTQGLVPNAGFVVTLYNSDPLSGAVNGWSRAQGPSPGAPPGSRFSPERMSAPDSELGQALTAYRIMIVGEVYLPYSPIFNTLPAFFNNASGEIYASTIM
jgi:hypothetical protein